MTIQDLIFYLLTIPPAQRIKSKIKIIQHNSESLICQYPVEKEMLKQDENNNCIIELEGL